MIPPMADVAFALDEGADTDSTLLDISLFCRCLGDRLSTMYVDSFVRIFTSLLSGWKHNVPEVSWRKLLLLPWQNL